MSTRILEDRFELEKQLSHTDFSTVYLGCDRQHFQRPACLVVGLRYRQPEMRYRLEREAQVLERLGQTPQMPKVLAYFNQSADQSAAQAPKNSGKHSNKNSDQNGTQKTPDIGDDKNTFYIVHEHLVGHTIAQELTPGKRLSESYVAKLLEDVLTALSVAHNQGVVHQNLHPQHIVRQDLDGQIFLTEFGTLYRLAKSKITRDGNLQVTVPLSPHPYLSPEQRQPDYDKQPQPASDLYALGLIAIEALTGRPHYHLSYDPTNGLQWRDQVDISLPLAEFIDRLIRHSWRDRFADAQSALNTLVLANNRYRIAHDSRLPTVVAAPGGRISTQIGSLRSSSSYFKSEGGATSLSTYSSGNFPTLKRSNPYLLKIFIASFAVLIALGVGVKAYQLIQHRFTQLPQTWESWKTPTLPEYPQATAADLVPLLEDGSIQLRASAADAFWEMALAAETAGIQLYPLAGYRGTDSPTDAVSDLPISEQQALVSTDYPTGYAIDIGGADPSTDWQLSFTETDAFQWLEKNAQTYGFELSHPEEGLTGGLTSKEPWHWRYVNDSDSRKIFDRSDT